MGLFTRNDRVMPSSAPTMADARAYLDAQGIPALLERVLNSLVQERASNGLARLAELCRAAVEEHEDEQRMRELFASADTTGSGRIDLEELRSFKQSIGEPLTDLELQTAFAEMLGGASGAIAEAGVDYAAFSAWYRSAHEAGGKLSSKGAAATARKRRTSVSTRTSRELDAILGEGEGDDSFAKTFALDQLGITTCGAPQTLEYRVALTYPAATSNTAASTADGIASGGEAEAAPPEAAPPPEAAAPPEQAVAAAAAPPAQPPPPRQQISPWHDVPLYPRGQGPAIGQRASGIVHMLIEIPKYSRAKFEVATAEPGNPIKQDVKSGRLREYTYGDICFNYGAFPQTWEDPSHTSEDTGCVGDNDPLDALEIGSQIFATGKVVKVKVLGCLAMIDDGETDWKVICISVDDPLAPQLNDVDDVERVLPGYITVAREWLRKYKTSDGKPMNAFGLDEKALNKEYTMKVIDETHTFWKRLVDSGRRTV